MPIGFIMKVILRSLLTRFSRRPSPITCYSEFLIFLHCSGKRQRKINWGITTTRNLVGLLIQGYFILIDLDCFYLNYSCAFRKDFIINSQASLHSVSCCIIDDILQSVSVYCYLNSIIWLLLVVRITMGWNKIAAFIETEVNESEVCSTSPSVHSVLLETKYSSCRAEKSLEGFWIWSRPGRW